MPNLNRLFRGPMAYLCDPRAVSCSSALRRRPQVEQARLSDVVKSITDAGSRRSSSRTGPEDHGTYTAGASFEASYTELQGKDLFNLAREEASRPGSDGRGQSLLVQILISCSPSPCSCCCSSSSCSNAGWRQRG